jgi:hypothetical protein
MDYFRHRVSTSVPASRNCAYGRLLFLRVLDLGASMKRRAFLDASTSLLVTALLPGPATGQPSARSFVKLATEGQTPPPATLADVTWLQGSWIGDMPEGPVEIVFMQPRFGQMPAFVRALNKDGIIFYEITVFVEKSNSLVIRLKHFTSALSGWEDKETYIERPLVAKDHNTLYFHRLTYVRTGPDSHTVYFLNMSGEHEGETLVIPFRRS